MTLKEIRAKYDLSQAEAASIAAANGLNIDQTKWSYLESITDEFVKTIGVAFGEEVELPSKVRHV